MFFKTGIRIHNYIEVALGRVFEGFGREKERDPSIRNTQMKRT